MSASSSVSVGFRNAPVCKFLLGSAISSSFLLKFPLKQHQSYFIYTHSQVFDKYQIWRVLTSKLAFLDLKDLFVCSVLLYYFRVFEKRFGSRKFSSYLLGSGVLTILLELLCVFLCRKLEVPLQPLPTGPLCIIYPLFVPFFCDIPRVALSHVWGVPMTGKSISYILGLQAASTSPESLVVAICGLVAGILWRVNFLHLQSVIKVPHCLARLCHHTIGRLFNSKDVHENTTHIGATIEIQRQEAMERLEQQVIWRSLQNSRHQPQNLVNGPGIFGGINNNDQDDLRQRIEEDVEEMEVSEEQVQHMVEMGFSQDQVRHALQMSNNDVSMATNFLLQQN
ncbi:ubiquitin-associated domain-containing protein 2-like [Ruditapes philippinarum]|uniref:ubiquitin-associated domain-containing protein 2-like n=1 Tax=Ruditapes philippinarum TaxID=129788 RepID=UPI00295ABA15|nr:ubiquitin-associated domain-containing protein 2-like [Ruditapes philippinarum]